MTAAADSASPRPPLLKLRDLDVAIDRVQILRGVSVDVYEGETLALIGRNGAGKTTTLRAIMGLLEAERGEIRLGNRRISGTPAHTRARLGIGYMPEDRRLIPRFTVEENILMPSWVVNIDGVAQRLEEIYQRIPEVAGFAKRQALSLSGGQQKLVALARAMLVGTRVLLLDEPFEGVAPALVQRIHEIVLGLSSSKERAVLVCDSSQDHAKNIHDRSLFIERGSVSALKPGWNVARAVTAGRVRDVMAQSSDN